MNPGKQFTFYHGTNREFQPGDVIRPGHEANDPEYSTTGGSAYAWATRDPANALGYADIASRREGGTMRVYRVEPMEPLRGGGRGLSRREGVGRSSQTATRAGWQVMHQAYEVEPEAYQGAQRARDQRMLAGAVPRARRQGRQHAYERDARLTSAEQGESDRVKADMDPQERSSQDSINDLLRLLH